ncbi:MAG: tetratricopeptide repeat protein [Alphaproteobacteria bacterium]|nr:tetratricopeptide repeat protein [Alphaproteobacteria bacterium]
MAGLAEQDLTNAIAAHRAGNIAAAVAGYRTVLARQPQSFDAIHLYAVALSQLGDYAESDRYFAIAVEAQPDDPTLRYNLGQAFLKRDSYSAAADQFARAVDLSPNYADAWNALGYATGKLGLYINAATALKRAIDANPTLAEAYINLADVALSAKNSAEADIILTQGVRRCPVNAILNYRLALRYLETSNLELALARFDAALVAAPGHAEAHAARGVVLHRLGDLQAALDAYNQAIALQPDLPLAHSNLSVLLNDLGRPAESVAHANRAIAAKPDYAEAYSNLGNALKDQGRFEEALSAYTRALEIQPTFVQGQLNRAIVLMTLGRHREGWQAYESRWDLADPRIRNPKFNVPRWTGQQDIVGKTIIVWWEQGLGDTLQFSLYIDLLKQAGARVVMLVQKSLRDFLAANLSADAVLDDAADFGVADFHIPLMSLPAALNHDIEDIPALRTPYRPRPEKVEIWRSRLNVRNQPVIGIAWSGNPNRDANTRRSVPLEGILAAIPPGLRVVALQTEISSADRLQIAETSRIELYDQFLTDFDETAALSANIDLVISVDTSVAHLAGLLGKETWLLLERVPAWRWFVDRTDTPWYPATRLFRQEQLNDWRGLLKDVEKSLRERRWRSPTQ